MRLALVACSLVASSAGAQTIYTWVDDTGTVNYTDQLSTVPQGVKVDTTKGDELAMVNTREDQQEGDEVARPVEPAVRPARATSGSGHTSAISGEPLDEYQWKSRFRAAYAEVQSLEDEIAIDKKRLNEPGGYGYGPGVICGGTVAPGAVQPYRAVDQLTAMQARATIRPAPGVTITGDARVQHRPPPNAYAASPLYGSNCIATPSPDYERLRDKVERETAQLKRAQDALDDLERQASHHGVPREWRRP